MESQPSVIDARYENAIAVVGLAGRFPGASTLDEFWNKLRDGVECIRFFTPEELAAAGIPKSIMKRPGYVPARGAVEDIDRFDAGLFGVNPREAEIMDPQQRIFLECAWEVLEHASCNPDTFAGRIGVFAGARMSNYLQQNILPRFDELVRAGFNLQLLIGNDKDFLATRTSYLLNLRGPSYAVQTACSTSLVAVHVACRSLMMKECDLALAGGVALRVPHVAGYFYQDAGVVSPDGHCRAFDAAAQGTVPGDGCGIVALKRYSDAVADRDTIHALILGSAINNDGSNKLGFTAPGVEGQRDVMLEAQALAGVGPESISYIEAHGTGTPLGDVVEISALKSVFSDAGVPERSCAVGTVKANVGHLDTAAGVAGLMRAILALKHREIPPQVNFERLSPNIQLGGTPLFVSKERLPWTREPRIAGVTSLGLGGTNAHIIVEEAPAIERPVSNAPFLLPVQAAREAALARSLERLSAFLESNPGADLGDVGYTLATGRRSLPCRASIVCADRAGAIAQLRNHRRSDGTVLQPILWFGVSHSGLAGVASELAGEPAFEEALDECRATGVQFNEADLSNGVTRVAFEYAFGRLWASWGIGPSAVVGFGASEYAAAALAGLISVAQALMLAAQRSKCETLAPVLPRIEVDLPARDALSLAGSSVNLVAEDRLRRCVLAGEHLHLRQFETRLDAERVQFRRLVPERCMPALPSAARSEFARALLEITSSMSRVRFWSNDRAEWIEPGASIDAGHWERQLSAPARAASALAAISRMTGSVLLSPQSLGGSSKRSCREGLLDTVGQLWESGINIDWNAFYRGRTHYHVPLPTYPFERASYWIAPPIGQEGSTGAQDDRPRLRLYAPSWRRASLPIGGARIPSRRSWLVFVDDGELAAAFVGNLRSTGATVHKVIAGPAYRHSQGETAIDPGDASHYERLLVDVTSNGFLPDAIVHFWNAGPIQGTLAERLEHGKRDAFFSVMFLAQAWTARSDASEADLFVVSTGIHAVTGVERLAPERSLLLGVGRAIAREYPDLRFRSVDIVSDRSAADLASHLLAEFTGTFAELEIAHRGGYRWTPSYDEIPQDTIAPTTLRDGGLYVITGGWGGIGLEIADYLVQSAKARVALLGRHLPNDPDTTSKIKDLEALGGRILLLEADVTDAAQTAAAIAKVREEFGAIHGVVHAAGVTSGGLLQVKTPHAVRCVLAPKVDGACVLDEALAGTALDFFLLCSSMSSITGGFGLADYAAANTFLDRFAWWRRTVRPGLTVAVNWSVWRDTGMSLRREVLSEFRSVREAELEQGLSREEALRAFGYAVAIGAPQIAVTRFSIESMLAGCREFNTGTVLRSLEERQVNRSRHSRPNLSTAFCAPASDTERRIAAVWESLLGVDGVGVLDNFFQLGGHSLLALQITSQLRDLHGYRLTLREFFAGPTIRQIAAKIGEGPCRPEPQPAIAAVSATPGRNLSEFLAELQALPEDEADLMFRTHAGS